MPVPEELPGALAAIPWPWGHLAILVVLLLGLLTYLQRRHKLLSDARLGLVFLSVLIQLFTGKPKTFVNCFDVRLCVWMLDGVWGAMVFMCVCWGARLMQTRNRSTQTPNNDPTQNPKTNQNRAP